jgi:flagellar secretion chaperone FliS
MYGKGLSVQAYRQVSNLETNPLRQVILLYDGAAQFLRRAAEAIEAQDIAAKTEHCNRALDIIAYLTSILDYERGAENAQAYGLLYACVSRQVVRASAAMDADLMRRSIELLTPVRDAWAQIAEAA